MKVVLDANIFISSLISKLGHPRKIIELWESGDIDVLITRDILDEVGRVLRYPRIVKRHRKDEQAIERYLDLLQKQATVVEEVETLDVVEDDESDNRYVECAVSGGADYLVTGDNHLLAVRQYRGIMILSPAVFILLTEKTL